MDEGALEERLRSLLSEGLDHALRPTDESHHHQQRLARRLEIASSVYSSWTGKENDASKLASKIADGSVDNLRSFVTEKDEDDGVEATSTVTVEVRDAEDLSYEEFWLRYMFENKPVLVSHIGREWRATREWTDHNGALSLGALSEAFGDAQVWVTHCTSTAEKSAGERERWTVREYIENYWRKDEGDRGNRSLYLKDWHFPTEFADYGAYETPKYFRDDWLNEYYDHLASNAGPGGAGDKTDQQALECSDYRFLYMGPKGTKTGLHADVLRSFSWSINISGRKVSSLQTPPGVGLVGPDRASPPSVSLPLPRDGFFSHPGTPTSCTTPSGTTSHRPSSGWTRKPSQTSRRRGSTSWRWSRVWGRRSLCPVGGTTPWRISRTP